MFIDSHCHLGFKDLGCNSKETLDFLIKAKQNNVSNIINIATDESVFENYLSFNDMVNKNPILYPKVFTALGIHPLHIAENINWSQDSIIKHIKNSNIVAIGETGLDKYHSNNSEDLILQKKFFEEHNQIAIKYNLPVIIHTRNAQRETYEILKEYSTYGKFRGVIHCFSGDFDFAKKMIDLNFYISFSGIVTFKNSHELQNVAKQIPINHILTETDAPYLAPIPHRGKINQPAFVKYTSEYIASIRSQSLDYFTGEVKNNFHNLFNRTLSNHNS